MGKPDAPVASLAGKVQAGDPSNIEGQAARRYWTLLFDNSFRRDQEAEGVNSLLNYGYTIVRSTMARAIMASGLHPGIPLHHRQKGNPLRLVDDLMEPYRPFVDYVVWYLNHTTETTLTPQVKKTLAGMAEMAVTMPSGVRSLRRACQETVHSLSRIYQGESLKLILPKPVMPSWQHSGDSSYGEFERAPFDVDDGYV